MSLSPLEWKKTVIEAYGSLFHFQDKSTVEIVRAHISAKRAENIFMLDIAEKHPGTVSADMISDMTQENAALSDLDADLQAWLTQNRLGLQGSNTGEKTG